MRFDNRRKYPDGSQDIWADAQALANENGSPVAVLSRGGWLVICDDAEMFEDACEDGWMERALIEPMEADHV